MAHQAYLADDRMSGHFLRMPPHRERGIFEACLEIAPDDRARYLQDACANDPELAKRVQRLLAAHDQAEKLPSTIRGEEHSVLDDPTDIGPYRILERIGEGGMGVVYVAEQTRPIKRLVALKVIKVGMDTKDVIARFDSERQALALMNHPNIARILDAGATDSGRPFFVMEYVRGQSIVEYCDERRLDIDARLRLFIDVCSAVDHAHGKGVIHRDIKRTNILVTEEDGTPRPKVIDFGIAKATNQRLTEMTLFTKMGHVVGTPEYMSPEQAGGVTGDIDTRTDVYSLGVVLYELLIGVRPFQFTDSESGYDEVLRVIREVVPPTLSSRFVALPDKGSKYAEQRSLTSSTLAKRLRGDLDWIAQKALAKDKDKRYQSAKALATDVQRLLDGVPISTAPQKLWSRTRLWLSSRRKVAVAAVVLAIAVSAIQWSRSRMQTTPVGSARVLVMPFRFLGPEDESYLAEGLTEEITDRLSGLANLRVLGRQTAVYAASRNMSPEAIADELGVDFVLDGTVRIQGSEAGPAQMRIRAALTSMSTLTQLWSETYEGALDDVFGVQADVAERVVNAVGVELPARDVLQLANQPTQDLEAYDYFLRGNEYSRRSELESPMRAALQLYEEATRLDPNFAEAWAAASVMRSRLRWRSYDRSEENLEAARRAGERALAINADAADGHLALGYYYYYGFRDYESALEHLAPAVERRPHDPETLFALGIVARRLGDWDRAIAALTAALNANPRHSEVAVTLGETLLAFGNYGEAERYFDRAIAIAPDRPSGHLFKAWTYLASKPDIAPAVEVLQNGWEEVGGSSLFALYGVYLSDLDWWISRVMASDSRYQQMFWTIDLETVSIDSVAFYLHSSELHKTLGNTTLSMSYADSARTVLVRRGGLTPEQGPSELNVIQREQQATRLITFATASLGAGDEETAITAAYNGMRFFSREYDALHGSEVAIQVGLIEAQLGMRDSAATRLAEVFAHPSSFRIEMLKHDPTLSWLIEDPRFRYPDSTQQQ